MLLVEAEIEETPKGQKGKTVSYKQVTIVRPLVTSSCQDIKNEKWAQERKLLARACNPVSLRCRKLLYGDGDCSKAKCIVCMMHW